MLVIQISDCHLFADIQKLGYQNINPYHSLQCVLKEVSSYQPDLLLVTGDVSGDGSLESYQHFKTLLAQSELTCEVSILPGNHDQPDKLKIKFAETQLWLASPLDVSTNWNIHLVNTHYKGTLGHVSVADLANLSHQLKQTPDKFHLVATHHHPISCGGWMDKHEWLNSIKFTQLIECHPSVKGVVYGHIHSDIETTINNICYMACPSTCWQWATTETFKTSELMPGFRVIKLLENGQISTSIKRLL
jgi:Icc protein